MCKKVEDELRETLMRMESIVDLYDQDQYYLAKDLANIISLLCYDSIKNAKKGVSAYNQGVPIYKTQSLLTAHNLKGGIKMHSMAHLNGLNFADKCIIKLCKLYCYGEGQGAIIINNSYLKKDIIRTNSTKARFLSFYRNIVKNNTLGNVMQNEERFISATFNIIPFTEWWTKEAVVIYKGKGYSRRDVVQFIRNKDLGSHREKDMCNPELVEYKELNNIFSNAHWYCIKNITSQEIKMDYSGVYEIIRSISAEIILSLKQIIIV